MSAAKKLKVMVEYAPMAWRVLDNVWAEVATHSRLVTTDSAQPEIEETKIINISYEDACALEKALARIVLHGAGRSGCVSLVPISKVVKEDGKLVLKEAEA